MGFSERGGYTTLRTCIHYQCGGKNDPRTGLSYGDVLLGPPALASRKPERDRPLDAADAVDRTRSATALVAGGPVTEAETATALSRIGGFGTIHHFITAEEQARAVRAVTDTGGRVGAAIEIRTHDLDR